MTDKKTPQPYFCATLTPHRSLSSRGFLILMTMLTVVSFTAGIFFITLGAWPVMGFFGLDVMLVYWAFRKNYADGFTAEIVTVNETRLIVQKLENGELVEEKTFTRGWVRAVLEIDRAREITGPLLLQSGGMTMEIGSFLSSDERKSFYHALNKALSLVGKNPGRKKRVAPDMNTG